MKITMISNYINHHQMPFSQALYAMSGVEYRFIQTEPMEQERVDMGWAVDASAIPYVVLLDEQPELCKHLILDSDILLAGWTKREDLIEQRLKAKKLTLRISERIYREGQWKAISPRGLMRKYKDHTSHRKDPVYLLCAGAYVPSDFSLIKAYPGKMYRFGYFPELKKFTPQELAQNHPWGERKNDREIQLVWAGRFIPLKKPEQAVKLAWRLKQQGYRFHLHFIGAGELEEELKQQVRQKNLMEEITFYGFLPPAQVRTIMEKCHIHLFTSNHLEGWGAVINEAMNSGCAEVVNAQVGAAPFLIRHGENGLVYPEGSEEAMEKQVRYLLDHPTEGSRMGREAYHTIVSEWNPETAAKRLVEFYEQFCRGQINPPQSGPFSPAPVISPGKMYADMMEKGRKLIDGQ